MNDVQSASQYTDAVKEAYEVGYREGGASRDADYECRLNEYGVEAVIEMIRKNWNVADDIWLKHDKRVRTDTLIAVREWISDLDSESTWWLEIQFDRYVSALTEENHES